MGIIQKLHERKNVRYPIYHKAILQGRRKPEGKKERAFGLLT